MLALKTSWLELPLADNPKAMFHYAWLRDNCCCVECKHPTTHERVLATFDIPDDIAPTSADVSGIDSDKILRVVWNHNQHVSEFSIKWLAEHDYSGGVCLADSADPALLLWGKELHEKIPRFDYQKLHQDPSQLLAWAEAVRDIGLTIVQGAPLVEGEIERFAEYVAVVRETIYDRLHNVKASPGEYNAYNVASTTLELKPHTDMPNYNNPPGVQMFHFLANESVGGESTAVDGFHVAEQLRKEDSEAFNILARTPVRFKMVSSRGDVQAANPLLTLDPLGNLKVFRFSNQLAEPLMLSVDETEGFYRAYRKLGRMLDSTDYKIQFRLNTGDIMVTNNLRVLHGRNSYDANSGARHLQLSYMDFDDVLSRIRLLKSVT